MAKRQLTPEFHEFLECLNRAGVDYLLVGGFAVNYYGYHRFTENIDFWIAASDENFDRVLAAVRGFFGEDLDGLNRQFLKNNEVLYLGRVPNKIEIIQKISGVEFASAWQRRVDAVIDDIPVKLISYEDLKTNKRASGRAKDAADLENLP